jgi:hypothetical protein
MAPLSFINVEVLGVDARDKRRHDEPLAPTLDNFKVRN